MRCDKVLRHGGRPPAPSETPGRGDFRLVSDIATLTRAFVLAPFRSGLDLTSIF